MQARTSSPHQLQREGPHCHGPRRGARVQHCPRLDASHAVYLPSRRDSSRQPRSGRSDIVEELATNRFMPGTTTSSGPSCRCGSVFRSLRRARSASSGLHLAWMGQAGPLACVRSAPVGTRLASVGQSTRAFTRPLEKEPPLLAVDEVGLVSGRGAFTPSPCAWSSSKGRRGWARGNRPVQVPPWRADTV